MKPSIEQLSSLDMLEETPLSVAFAMLFYEDGQPVCARAARSFRGLLGQSSRPTSKSPGFTPFSEACLAEVLKTAAGNATRIEQWRGLEEAGFSPFNPVDCEGEAAPQCVILLGARHLLEDTLRGQFTAALQKVARDYSQFLIIFVAERGEVPFDTDENTFRTWVEDFARLTPKPVTLHLVSSEFETGQPVSLDELADGIAVCLHTDLILTCRRAARVLSDMEHGELVVLAALGVKGMIYDAEGAAAFFKRRMAGEWVGQNLLRTPRNMDRNASCVASLRELLAGLNLGGDGVSVRIVNGGHPSILAPVLQAKDYAIGFDFDCLQPGTFLDLHPPKAWATQLRVQREFLDQVTIPAVGSQVQAALAEFGAREIQDLVREIGGVVEQDGIRMAQILYEEKSNYLAATFWTAEPCAVAPSTVAENAVADVELAVARIPTPARLILIGLAWLAIIAAFAGLACYMGLLSRWETVGICLTAAAACGAHFMWSYHQAKHVARKAVVNALEHIRQEARVKLNALVHQCAVQRQRLCREEFLTCREGIRRLAATLTELSERADSPTAEPPYSRAIIRAPWGSKQVERLNAYLREANALDTLHAEFKGSAKNLVPKILGGYEQPEALVSELERLSQGFCRQRLERLQLADFLEAQKQEAASHCDIQANEACRQLHERPSVFLQNTVANDCISNSHRMTRVLVAPETLEGRCGVDHNPIRAVNRNVIAMIVRLKLATLEA